MQELRRKCPSGPADLCQTDKERLAEALKAGLLSVLENAGTLETLRLTQLCHASTLARKQRVLSKYGVAVLLDILMAAADRGESRSTYAPECDIFDEVMRDALNAETPEATVRELLQQVQNHDSPLHQNANAALTRFFQRREAEAN